MKVLGLLTGKGNSTLKDKNVLKILGHPVLYYPANAAKQSKIFDCLYCASDGKKVLKAAKQSDFESIVLPENLVQPTSQHIDTIKYALEYLEKKEGLKFDIVVVLLANNVSIKSSWLKDCVNEMKNNMNCSAIVPIFEDNDHHPLRAKRINEYGNLDSYELGHQTNISTNRQDLPKNYFLAHNFWVLNVKKLKENELGNGPWNFMGKTVKPYIINRSVDIHVEEDLYLAADWIKDNYED